jgi:cob(I)alamin adenosyltransferase
MLSEKEILEELRMEIAFIKRDIIERLRRIEEYITFIDSDISKLRLDIQRINDRIKEIIYEKEEQIESKKTEEYIEKKKISKEVTQQKYQKEDLNPTEIAIIKYLIEHPGTRSATPIAQSIGKAREHVARLLKKLAERKLIIRDESTWPYTYSVPDEVKKMILGK